MLNNTHNGSSGPFSSNKHAIWQSEWLDEMWQQMTDGTYNGVGSVVVDDDVRDAESRLQSDLDYIDDLLLGSPSKVKKDLSELKKPQNQGSKYGVDSLTGFLPSRKKQQSLANIMRYLQDTGLPDLAIEIQDSGFSKQAKVGDKGSVEVVIRNEGGLTAESPATITIYASQSEPATEAAIEIGQYRIQELELKPDKYKKISVNVQIPEGFPSGDYRFVAVVNTEGQLREANTQNNIAVTNERQTIIGREVPTEPINSLLPKPSTHDCALPFAVIAEGQVKLNGYSDFDGDPLLPEDDALIYGGQGLYISGRPVLPTQRDEGGNLITDDEGRPLLVENAIATSAGYEKYKVPSKDYGGLDTPSLVTPQVVDVLSHEDLVNETLAGQIPAETTAVEINVYKAKLKKAEDWYRLFPADGTPESPTVVRVTGGALKVPKNVNLSNLVLIVEEGDFELYGYDHRLDNVTIVVRNGKAKLNKVSGTNVRVLASEYVKMSSEARFSG